MGDTVLEKDITGLAPADIAACLADHIPFASGNDRQLIALAGPPASGKSTLAAALVSELNSQGRATALLPMDGFHLGNDVLEHRGLLARKGAPDTFDAESFVGLVKRSQTEPTVKVPVFDRENDRVIPNAAEIAPHHRTLVAEGNYLLLDQTPWHQLADIWAVQVFLDVPADRLRSRLVQRWRDHGLSQVDAERRTAENDLPNALYVQQNSRLNGQYSIRLRSD